MENEQHKLARDQVYLNYYGTSPETFHYSFPSTPIFSFRAVAFCEKQGFLVVK